MTRQTHDQFAKQYLSELLEPSGHVEKSLEISGEARFVDLYFTQSAPPEKKTLGLLSRMVSSDCLLEPFRNQPTKNEIRDCLLKLFSLYGELQRKAKHKTGKYLKEDAVPFLWIIATSASTALIDSLGATQAPDDWGKGIYFLPQALKTAIIAINQLPKTKETLWLRILGKGNTQQEAIEELLAFPDDNDLRNYVQELLSTWRISLKLKDNLNEEEQELFMNINRAYQQWREKTLLQGIQQGLQQGLEQGLQQGMQQGNQQGDQQGHLDERRDFVESLLEHRFGQLDHALLQVVNPLIKHSPSELSGILLKFSREEILAQFTQK